MKKILKIDDEICAKILKDTISILEQSSYYTIDDWDKIIISKENGVVYFLYVCVNNQISLKYIGKSSGKYFRSRLKSHFFGIGKGTHSKYKYIEREVGFNIYFKYIETTPIYVRNLLEEMLLIDYKMNNVQLWNYK